ncbi:MAG TPA: CHAT domain-containing protein, partial [Allosphingosinicella sp.]
MDCAAEGGVALDGVGKVGATNCRLKDADVGYRVYSWRAGNTLYVAEGLAGYDSALRLGLRTLVADRPVDGEISIATTEAGNATSFARAQAGTLDPQRALAEAYRRNNAGHYAEAAEFFGSLLASGDTDNEAEAMLNQALQQSNLGNYVEANTWFGRAAGRIHGDPVLARMARNYRALHLLNQNQPRQAMAELDRPLPEGAGAAGNAIETLRIDAGTAARLNADTSVSRQLSAAGDGLLPADKAQILDGQAEALRGTIFRLQGRPEEATRALNAASAQLGAIRGGRVTSTSWMRAQLLAELALIAEQRGDNAEAERQLQTASALVGANYPGSASLLNSQARLASFYTRTGQVEPAMTLFRQIVDANAETGETSPALRRTLTPYFALLAGQAGSHPDAGADMFKASQALVRPGVAQTQAILARELSGGSDEASRLFRQSVTLTRDVERTRIEISRLAALPQPSESELAHLAELPPRLAQMEQDQVETQAKLADFPRYRVVSGGAMSLAELQKELREGEAYYKLVMVGNDGYAIFATPTMAQTFRLPMSASALETEVDAIRATISTVENGQLVTYPFDVERAHKLYGALFQPIDGALANVSHLIFEPDGAMLRLPANLLVMDQAGIDAYLAKANRPDDDGFDFTDIKWLGRDRDISTAVSARSFRDVRRVERSRATHDYIGFGE